jgi:hypothetical protein
MALVHILIDVLDSLGRCNGLYIDVTLILPDEIPGVTDHPTIVNHLVLFNNVRVASVATPGAGIRVLSHSGHLPEGLGKAHGTFAIDHARCSRILVTTRSMNHHLLDQLKQLRVVIRKLRRHEMLLELNGG